MDTDHLGYAIVNLILDSGEKLPCLVESSTWIPVRVANRWAVNYRRYLVQFSTLDQNLRVLRRVYSWALNNGIGNFDDFLISGKRLSARQLKSLIVFLRSGGHNKLAGFIFSPQSIAKNPLLSSGSYFNQQLSIVENFLKWSLDNANCGGGETRSPEIILSEYEAMGRFFNLERVSADKSGIRQPITETEIEKIRQTIRPEFSESGKLTFRKGIFSPSTQLRNWLMFEMALDLGLRKGELLKIRLDCLPRGNERLIRILRLPDDPHDSRSKEPSVKTAERAIEMSPPLLKILKTYLTYPKPWGRPTGKSPYLFLSYSGEPLSIETANDIIQKIGGYSNVKSLSWHRLRHTWAERMAELFRKTPNGERRLMMLGGWTNAKSIDRYIKNTTLKQANEILSEYHKTMYGEDFDDANQE